MIYLDNAATTPMDEGTIDVVAQAMRQHFANSGTAYRVGLDSQNAVEKAREEIAGCLGLPATHRMVFTSGGSEANNLFIKGTCFPDRKAAWLGLEHPSVTGCMDFLKESANQPVCLRLYRSQGRLNTTAIPMLKEQRVKLLCLSHVNNEVGTVQDARVIVAALKSESHQTRLFLDGVQAVGKLKVSADFWKDIAGYSLSAHKFHGPKGIGLLIYDSRQSLTPQIHGGNQQYGVRSGTLPVPLILGLAHSLKLAVEQVGETADRMKKLRHRMIEGLRQLSQRLPDFNLLFNPSDSEDPACQSPSIVNFSFPPVEGEVMLHHLEEKDIFVGMGSACSAHSKEPSKILTGMGLSDEEARCSLRVSFGRQNTLQDVEVFMEEFERAYRILYPIFSDRKRKR